MWIILTVVVLLVVAYLKIIKPHRHWQEKSVPHLKSPLVVGSMGDLVFKKRSFAHLTQDIYNSHPKQRYVCFYQFLQPTVMLRDPELIKQIAVRDFDIFPDHQPMVPHGVDPVWDKSLFGIKGAKPWYDLRAMLNPTFTNNKMKAMFGLMQACTMQFTTYFESQDGVIEVEMKDVFSRFSNDVICSTALGVTCDSLKNPDNKFFIVGRNVTELPGIRRLIIFAYTFIPSIVMKILKLAIVTTECGLFFKSIIRETIKIREEKGIVRPDMIHILMEARRDPHKNKDSKLVQSLNITDDIIVAQAVNMFLAAFDTMSSSLAYLSYELSVNADIQERLREEILSTLENCKGNVTYDNLLEMNYLDMVVSETLRKWPPAEHTDRQCVRNYTIEPKLPGEDPLHIDANTMLWIPIYAMQHDPKYYPNPDKFDPERFNEDNKKNIKPFTYLPFSMGPRICIGARYGILVIKLLMFEILRKFDIVPVERTQIPLQLCKGVFNMKTENGIWLGLKLRK